MRRYQRAKNVSNRRMTVPYTKDEPAFRLSKPTTHEGHYTWPSGRLENASEYLHYYEIPQTMDIGGASNAEHVGEHSGEDHAHGQEVSQGNAFRHETRSEHSDGIGEEEGRVQHSKECGGIGNICKLATCL